MTVDPRPLLLAIALLLVGGTGACGSYDGRPIEWEYISPVIIQPNCATASCHSRGAAVAGLDFSDAERGYTSLMKLRYQIVDRYATGENCTPASETVVCRGSYRPLVMPYSPSQSRLVHLLRNRTPPRMPPDRPIFEADIELIENWILLGAPRRRSDSGPAVLDASAGAEAGAPDAGASDAAPADGGAPDARDALPDRGPDMEPVVPTGNNLAERG